MKSETKTEHTPTPWQLLFGGVASTPDWSIHPGATFKEAVERDAICHLPETTTKTVEQVGANAKFIVRACNAHEAMLDALKGVTEHYAELINSGDAGNWDPEQEAVIIKARAAVALAEKGEK
jgi:hypothetical protein